jgi:hypothetical protein
LSDFGGPEILLTEYLILGDAVVTIVLLTIQARLGIYRI